MEEQIRQLQDIYTDLRKAVDELDSDKECVSANVQMRNRQLMMSLAKVSAEFKNAGIIVDVAERNVLLAEATRLGHENERLRSDASTAQKLLISTCRREGLVANLLMEGKPLALDSSPAMRSLSYIIQDLIAQRTDTQEDLAKSRAKCTQLKNTIHTLEKEKAEAAKTLRQHHREDSDQWKNERIDLDKVQQELKAKLDDLDKDDARRVTEFRTYMDGVIKGCQDSFYVDRKQIAELERQLEEENEASERLDGMLRDLGKQMDAAKDDYERTAASLKAADAASTELRDDNIRLEGELKTAKHGKETAEQETAAVRREADAKIESAWRECTEQVQSMKMQMESTLTTTHGTIETLNNTELELESTKVASFSSALDVEKARSAETTQALQQQLDKLNLENEELRASNEVAKWAAEEAEQLQAATSAELSENRRKAAIRGWQLGVTRLRIKKLEALGIEGYEKD